MFAGPVRARVAIGSTAALLDGGRESAIDAIWISTGMINPS